MIEYELIRRKTCKEMYICNPDGIKSFELKYRIKKLNMFQPCINENSVPRFSSDQNHTLFYLAPLRYNL